MSDGGISRMFVRFPCADRRLGPAMFDWKRRFCADRRTVNRIDGDGAADVLVHIVVQVLVLRQFGDRTADHHRRDAALAAVQSNRVRRVRVVVDVVVVVVDVVARRHIDEAAHLRAALDLAYVPQILVAAVAGDFLRRVFGWLGGIDQAGGAGQWTAAAAAAVVMAVLADPIVAGVTDLVVAGAVIAGAATAAAVAFKH